MPPESPRKSSTSSGRAKIRSRYLGVELLGEPVPARRLEIALRSAIPPGTFRIAPRVIRAQGLRAIVEVEHADAARARAAWNATLRPPGALPITVRTLRTWGTVRGGRPWVKGSRPLPPPVQRAPRQRAAGQDTGAAN